MTRVVSAVLESPRRVVLGFESMLPVYRCRLVDGPPDAEEDTGLNT